MISRLISIVCGSGLILATSGLVFAADMAVKAPPPPPPAVWDWSGFYIGVGGSYNWTHFDQSLQGISGLINVFNGPVLIAQGQEGGPFFDFNRNKSGFADRKSTRLNSSHANISYAVFCLKKKKKKKNKNNRQIR